MQEVQAISEAIKNLYLSLIIQGVIFIALAILIVIYPQLLFALASVAFLIIGMVLLALAVKIYSFWKKIPSFLKK